jgi:hypothetical protein
VTGGGPEVSPSTEQARQEVEDALGTIARNVTEANDGIKQSKQLQNQGRYNEAERVLERANRSLEIAYRQHNALSDVDLYQFPELEDIHARMAMRLEQTGMAIGAQARSIEISRENRITGPIIAAGAGVGALSGGIYGAMIGGPVGALGGAILGGMGGAALGGALGAIVNPISKWFR